MCAVVPGFVEDQYNMFPISRPILNLAIGGFDPIPVASPNPSFIHTSKYYQVGFTDIVPVVDGPTTGHCWFA
jgi:hypothetical protein